MTIFAPIEMNENHPELPVACCDNCEFLKVYRTGEDEYPQLTTIMFCEKEHWENGNPGDDYTKCFTDCKDFQHKN